MGAGHPPLGFELDTYSSTQPAHYRVDPDYIERKGRPNDIQIWALGQAFDLKKRMDALLDPRNAPKGLRQCGWLIVMPVTTRWTSCSGGRALDRVAAGRLQLYDTSAVMLRAVAARIAPGWRAGGHASPQLHHATTGLDRRPPRGAAVRPAADRLIPLLVKHQFDRADALALAKGVIAIEAGGDDLEYNAARHQTMALASIVAAMHLLGLADNGRSRHGRGAARSLRRGGERPELPAEALSRRCANSRQAAALAASRPAGDRMSAGRGLRVERRP